MSILAQILERKRREIALWKKVAQKEPRSTPPPSRRFKLSAVLRKQARNRAHVIAEIKFRSPSAGVIREHTDGAVDSIARAYARGGASMISVLADGPDFGGSIANVARVRRAVDLPILFKEFVLDPVQLDLARWAGADAVLLLVNAVDEQNLHRLVSGCHERGLFPLVEAANDQELRVALGTDASLIGINARDLHTFSVDPAAADALAAKIPQQRVAITMSGVREKERFDEVSNGRADAVLIGEGLMRQPEPGLLLQAWGASGPAPQDPRTRRGRRR